MEILIIGVVVLILYFNLRNRIDRLEELIRGRDPQKNTIPQTSGPLFEHPVAQPAVLSQVATPVRLETSESGPSSFDKFTEWFKDDWPLKVGVILLLIGFGWFTTYAFIHNWIGPMGRITLGIVAGVIFMLLGNWRMNKFLHQGGAFLVLGSTTVLLTIFAAREVYNFFTPSIALAVMFLSTAFVAFVSVKRNNRELALASLVLAGVAPLLTNAPTNDYVSLFSYLLVVVVGAIWVTVLTGRRELTTAALILITIYSLPHLVQFVSADKGALLLFVYAFVAIFFISNISALLKLKDEDILPDLITAGGNGLLLLVWILRAAQQEWKSLIIIAWTVVFLVGAYLIYKIKNNKKPFYTYAGLGVAMIAAATSVELSGASLVIAYAIESAAVSLVVYSTLKDLKMASIASILLVGPIWLSIGSFISKSWATSTFNKDFFVLFILALITFILGVFFREKQKETNKQEMLNVGPILIIIGSVYTHALVWKSLNSYFDGSDTGVMIALVVYTIVGIATYFYGKMENKKTFKMYGTILLGLVIARLFLVDIWNMEINGKIITFFLLGALLVSTAFIGKKKQVTENITSQQS